jgi:hypothetical protein
MIYLVDKLSGKTFKSPIFKASKHPEDRFIYSGWKKFVREFKPRFKDTLIFDCPSGDNRIEISIIRHQHLY